MDVKTLKFAGEVIKIGKDAMVKTLKGGKTAVLESCGKDSHLRIFSEEGKVLVDRLKSISTEIVGNKQVITKECIGIRNCNLGFKSEYSRISDSNGVLIGARKVEWKADNLFKKSKNTNHLALLNNSCKAVTKISDKGSVTKLIEGGITKGAYYEGKSSVGKCLNPYEIFNNNRDSYNLVAYNRAGVPIPNVLLSDGNIKRFIEVDEATLLTSKMSLKDMKLMASNAIKKFIQELKEELKESGTSQSKIEEILNDYKTIYKLA